MSFGGVQRRNLAKSGVILCAGCERSGHPPEQSARLKGESAATEDEKRKSKIKTEDRKMWRTRRSGDRVPRKRRRRYGDRRSREGATEKGARKARAPFAWSGQDGSRHENEVKFNGEFNSLRSGVAVPGTAGNFFFLTHHSWRRATIGSTRIARRAGIQHATRATTSRSAAVAANVSGSFALTPNSWLATIFVDANAATIPTAIPGTIK